MAFPIITTYNLSDNLGEEQTPTPSSPYDDHELDLAQDHIRLLTLLPGPQSSPITTTTAVVNLSSSPVYTALSYVWGDATNPVPIRFNTAPSFSITRNLHTALLYLRDETMPKIFWIDALCINQEHAGEKPHQVQMMGDIYKNANQTVIWLGEESETSDLAISLIRGLDGGNLTHPNNSPNPDGLKAIAELQRRAWWSRVWVIQEALLSANPIIQCGTQTLPMEAFMILDDIRRGWHRASQTYDRTAHNAITNFSVALRNPFSGIVTYWPDARVRLLNPTLDSSPSTLAEWAQYLSDFAATDPRDKIYGLLGLASDADRNVMRYALENHFVTSQVYTRAMMWFLITARQLLQLSFDTDSRAGCPVGETGNTLPSWVVDFSENIPEGEDPDTWFRVGYVPFTAQHHPYKATGDGQLLKARVEGEMFPFVEKVLALRVKGCVVDKVAFVCGNGHMRLDMKNTNTQARKAYSLERIKRTAEKVVEWEEEVLSDKWGRRDPYGREGGLDGRERAKVFRRTIVGNRDHEGGELEWDEEWETMLAVFLGKKDMPLGDDGKPATDEERLQYLLRIRLALIPRTAGRAFIITENGYIGLAPLKSKAGDEVCVLEGGTVSFVLRSMDNSVLDPFGVTLTGRQKLFGLVGEAYVHGVSDGEWIDMQTKEDVIEVVMI